MSDAIDVPLLVRLPSNRLSIGRREHGLFQPSMIFRWLASGLAAPRAPAFAAGAAGVPPVVRVFDSESFALRTPAWLLVDGARHGGLFVKPEDRWDVNPVQERCRGVEEQLRAVRAALQEGLSHGHQAAQELLAPLLAPELLRPPD
jgi:hypothetical protein